jgi:protein gp37
MMGASTSIEWADATVNWWAGCTAVSPACDHCYAKQMAGRLWGTKWGPGQPRTQFSGPVETLHALDRKAKRLGRPLRVFHNSLSDFFDNEVPQDRRDLAFQTMLETPNLIHMLLTKRIGNVPGMLPPLVNQFDKIFPNIWIGATICNQEEADRDIPKLLQVPAAKRFLSMEPLLEPVDLQMHLPVARGRNGWFALPAVESSDGDRAASGGAPRIIPREQDLHWIIVGGESGHLARPMHPDWARSLRDQCHAAGVPFMFKQWGEHAPNWLNDDAGNKISGSEWIDRMGKKIAGRLLDGRTWDEVPA